MEKLKIIETLATVTDAKAQFNKLLTQAVAHPHFPPGVARFLNASGYSAANLETLKYDVKKTFGITDASVRAYVPAEANVKVVTLDADTDTDDLLQRLLNADIDSLHYHKELKPLAVDYAEANGDELSDFKKDTLLGYLKKQKEEAIKAIEVEQTSNSNPYEEAETDAKDGLKLRVEFPFLTEDDCPDKLKILVADKFTALEKYEAAHEQIQELKAIGSGDLSKLFELGKKAVENWELNQLIYDELNHYQEHKEVLGNHPIFADEMLQKLVDAYSTQEAMKRQGNLRSYISRDTKKLENIKDADKKAKAEAKLKEWQDELDLIDARLNADQKK